LATNPNLEARSRAFSPAWLEPLFTGAQRMSRNYYSEINLHFVWHAKNSLPLLTPEVERLAYRFLKKRIVETPGAFVHEIGGTETHVHIAVSVPPTLTISELIGQLKGGSSHDVNQAIGRRDKVLQWQVGYGVVSFGTPDLPWVVEYIRNQREHHARGTAQDRLERITQEELVASAAQAVAARRPVNGPM
jgi:REP element-mobilizing transposase RayT